MCSFGLVRYALFAICASPGRATCLRIYDAAASVPSVALVARSTGDKCIFCWLLVPPCLVFRPKKHDITTKDQKKYTREFMHIIYTGSLSAWCAVIQHSIVYLTINTVCRWCSLVHVGFISASRSVRYLYCTITSIFSASRLSSASSSRYENFTLSHRTLLFNINGSTYINHRKVAARRQYATTAAPVMCRFFSVHAVGCVSTYYIVHFTRW